MKKSLSRVTASSVLLIAALSAQPVAAEPGEGCSTLCMVATGTSGYVGEDAMWYFLGCYTGCTMASA